MPFHTAPLLDLYGIAECGGHCPECGGRLWLRDDNRGWRCRRESCYRVLVTDDKELWRKYDNRPDTDE